MSRFYRFLELFSVSFSCGLLVLRGVLCADDLDWLLPGLFVVSLAVPIALVILTRKEPIIDKLIIFFLLSILGGIIGEIVTLLFVLLITYSAPYLSFFNEDMLPNLFLYAIPFLLMISAVVFMIRRTLTTGEKRQVIYSLLLFLMAVVLLITLWNHGFCEASKDPFQIGHFFGLPYVLGASLFASFFALKE